MNFISWLERGHYKAYVLKTKQKQKEALGTTGLRIFAVDYFIQFLHFIEVRLEAQGGGAQHPWWQVQEVSITGHALLVWS